VKLWHGVVIGIGALALMGGGLGSTVSHVARGVDNVTSAAGGGNGGSIIPPDVRLTAEAAGGYALAKGGAARLSQPRPTQPPAPVAPPTSEPPQGPPPGQHADSGQGRTWSQVAPGPLMHPWAPPVTAAPQPAAPLGDTSKGGWHFGVPSLGNLADNLEGIGRAVIPGANGGGSTPAPVPVPAPAPVPIVVVP
jgi:hypothetical protein